MNRAVLQRKHALHSTPTWGICHAKTSEQSGASVAGVATHATSILLPQVDWYDPASLLDESLDDKEPMYLLPDLDLNLCQVEYERERERPIRCSLILHVL